MPPPPHLFLHSHKCTSSNLRARAPEHRHPRHLKPAGSGAGEELPDPRQDKYAVEVRGAPAQRGPLRGSLAAGRDADESNVASEGPQTAERERARRRVAVPRQHPANRRCAQRPRRTAVARVRAGWLTTRFHASSLQENRRRSQCRARRSRVLSNGVFRDFRQTWPRCPYSPFTARTYRSAFRSRPAEAPPALQCPAGSAPAARIYAKFLFDGKFGPIHSPLPAWPLSISARQGRLSPCDGRCLSSPIARARRDEARPCVSRDPLDEVPTERVRVRRCKRSSCRRCPNS